MATYELFSPVERQEFTHLPDTLSDEFLARYYLFSDEELKVIKIQRGSANRLGFAIQLGYLHFPGRFMEVNEVVPTTLVNYIAAQLGVSPAAFASYAQDRPATRREHMLKIQRELGFKLFEQTIYQELSNWLLPTALRTEHSVVLMRTLVTELRLRQIIMPGFYQLEKLVWEVRKTAQTQIWSVLNTDLSKEQQIQLDSLLKTSKDKRTSDLAWLRRAAGKNSPTSFKHLVERVEFIRNFKLDPLVARKLSYNRLLQLAQEGNRLTAQHLIELEAEQRYAILVAFLLERSYKLTDQALEMHNNLIGQLFNKSEHKQQQHMQVSGRALNEKVQLYAQVGQAIITAKTETTDPYQAIEGVISWDNFVESVNEAGKLARPVNFDYLDLFESRYQWLRQYSKRLLEVFDFKTVSQSADLGKALVVLKELNADGERKIPKDAPTAFIKPRWEPHVIKADGNFDRHYYEMCALSELRGALKSGDVWVEGSRQFSDFDGYMQPKAEFLRELKTEQLTLPFKTNVADYLAERILELSQKLQEVDRLVGAGKLEIEIDEKKGDFHLANLTKEIPDGVDELKQKAYQLLPHLRITDLLVEMDEAIHFSRHFTHQQTGAAVSGGERPALLAAILADGLNLSLAKMSEASPNVGKRGLSRVSDWYIREETYRKALAEIVNFQHHLPFASNFGQGKTSSSDGQQFRAGGLAAQQMQSQVNLKYGNQPGIMFYTHLSDQYIPYYVQAISTTARQAPYMLDGLLYHQSELNIEEHYTDTHGYTDQVFGAAHLLGFRFAPRIKDIGSKRLYCVGKPEDYPNLAPLIATNLNLKVVDENWEEILRMINSVQKGTVTASLILNKLAAYPRQHRLAWALREIGRLEKTLFTLDWMSDPKLRRRVLLGLNKGESRNSLARAVFFYRLGEIRERSWEDQLNRASGLTLLTALISTWNTVYLDLAIEKLQKDGLEISDEQLAHLSPLGWQHLILTGDYIWNMHQNYNMSRLRPLRNLNEE